MPHAYLPYPVVFPAYGSEPRRAEQYHDTGAALPRPLRQGISDGATLSAVHAAKQRMYKTI